MIEVKRGGIMPPLFFPCSWAADLTSKPALMGEHFS